ncbi:hypothetical protein D7X32_24305 [Corallococcus carmarthensis]|uniref:Uncharacterized protein n=1 Tax=Corallococcus carmarthensis TaxID=2316728 RepID=A0A3A8K743_9BACT|nr:hypothetical protein D7X32_24305 [Corallococcus carmarthensis]
MSDAVGRSSYRLDFDYIYSDNTGSCTYTFCSREPTCQTRSFSMTAPIQYSPPPSHVIDSVTPILGLPWNTGAGPSPCPNLSGAIGQTFYALNFDNYYADNSGTCAYTFCSHPRMFCETRTYRGMKAPLQYEAPPGATVINVTADPAGLWNSGVSTGPCPDMYGAIGKTSYTLNFDSIYTDNSGTCAYTFCSQG